MNTVLSNTKKQLQKYTKIFEEQTKDKLIVSYSQKEKEMYDYLGMLSQVIVTENASLLEETTDPFVCSSKSGAEITNNPSTEKQQLQNETAVNSQFSEEGVHGIVHTSKMKMLRKDTGAANKEDTISKTLLSAANKTVKSLKTTGDMVTTYLANPKFHLNAIIFQNKRDEIATMEEQTAQTRKRTEDINKEIIEQTVANKLSTLTLLRATLYVNHEVTKIKKQLTENPEQLAQLLVAEFGQPEQKASVPLKIAQQ